MSPQTPGPEEPRRPRRRKLVLALVSLAIGFLGCEALSRVWFRFNPGVHWRVGADSAWRLAWLRRQQGGIELYRPGVDLFDPLLGWRNRPGFVNDEPILGSEVVHIDSRGARGTREVPYERTDARRIVVIGDSFAFGWGVSDEETYAHRLAEALPGVEVVNLGGGGYGTDQMLLMLREEGLRYSPDLVVVGIVSADTERNLVAFRDFAKPRFVLRAGELELVDVPVPTPDEVRARSRLRPRLFDLVDVLRTAVDARGSGRARRAERLTTALWERIDAEARAAGARTLFLFAPIDTEIGAAGPGACERMALAFTEAHGVLLLNLGDEFRERQRAGETFRPGHWGPHAHAVIAGALARAIADGGLLEQ